MFDYIIGDITYKSNDYIVIENNKIGYGISVANANIYNLYNRYKIYIYVSLSNDLITLYGFKSLNMRNLFLKIINVKGIGPKTAINIFKNNDEEQIIKAINDENIEFLKSLPNIGMKSAKQIILDLKGKLVNNYINDDLKDIKYALKDLGFKSSDIDRVLLDLSKEKHSIDEYLKLALSKLSKR